ncbi:hypothetical protein PGT21_010530 [Puccinia graminis f. sp. tritici]|uniref:Uncharacterized protein n=1 Tax=Puccinia graminis f. sp. tritici TaxID=56615 RepID=A0A5B0PDC5_PUCGR|nr:hypothetical protein PGT21_010530 [Puccinia graminis f. sp. tritici]KAA1098670.1 hypothetical protein PGTUg99_014587 [Puccinia graminis f. sp. tritici]
MSAPALDTELIKLIRLCYRFDRESNSPEEEEVSPEQDLKTRQEKLNRVESTILPAIRDLVTELLEALDLPAKDTISPQPKLDEALEIVPRFTSLVQDLASSVLPPDYSNPEICQLIDQNYGQFNQFRSRYLKKNVTQLIKEDLSSLFNSLSSFVSDGEYYAPDYEPSDRNKPSQQGPVSRIQVIIPRISIIIRGSNFDIIQSIWNQCEDLLHRRDITDIHWCINLTNTRAPARVNPDFTAHTPAVLELLDQTLVLLKMFRLFSRKIGSTRLFTFGKGLSTAELASFGDVSENFEPHILSLIVYMETTAEFQEKPPGWDFKHEAEVISHDVNFCLDFIRSHMVPSYPPQTVDEVMDRLFGTFTEQFFPTFNRYIARLTQFQAEG